VIIDLKVLGIETSDKIASCCVYDTTIDEILGEFTIQTEKTHSQIILPLCSDLLSQMNLSLKDIEAIAVSKGPGSYTGIRIGISVAKAIAFALDIKCYGVSALYALAVRVKEKGYICSVIRARQDLVYSAVYQKADDGSYKEVMPEQLIEKASLNEYLSSLDDKIIITGNEAENFVSEYSDDKYILTEKNLGKQSSVSLCFAVDSLEPVMPDNLNASYLQLTEAERNLKQ
jgi:tRNA threonylcarbamoyladenosine biosynthesis protein TsaB